jgi:glycosyltransferase involved in cell wall biosynthesis
MRIQGLLTDNPINIMGGMGEQLKNNLKYIDKKYHFDIIGCDKYLEYKGDNFHFKALDGFFSIYGGRIDPLFAPFVNQNLFIEKSFEFPKPDIIHSFDWSTFMPAIFLAKYYKVPLICTIQLSIKELIKSYNIDPYASPIYRLHEAMEVEGLNSSDAIIQVSHAYAKNTNKIFWPKTYVVENGIELNEWQPKNQITLPGKNKYKVIFIGRIEYQKNIQAILEVNLPKDLDLIIIGGHKGSAAELVEKVIRRSETDKNFIYVGPKYNQEKIDMLFAADAVIMPSIHEPFGIVALEALASKSILLSSFVDGMGDFLTEDVAINCGTSKESIEKALDNLINLQEEERVQRIKKGLEICQEYTWEKSAKKIAAIYSLFV